MDKCNHDCFNCAFPDCIEEKSTSSELAEIKTRDFEDGSIKNPKNPYSTKWARQNKEKNREIALRYYYENHETEKEKRKKYYQEHREYFREYFKNYKRRKAKH